MKTIRSFNCPVCKYFFVADIGSPDYPREVTCKHCSNVMRVKDYGGGVFIFEVKTEEEKPDVNGNVQVRWNPIDDTPNQRRSRVIS